MWGTLWTYVYTVWLSQGLSFSHNVYSTIGVKLVQALPIMYTRNVLYLSEFISEFREVQTVTYESWCKLLLMNLDGVEQIVVI